MTAQRADHSLQFEPVTVSRPIAVRKPRGAYSRLICLGCRERRIRCELPGDVERPGPGELKTTQTPCHRCKRLGIPCTIRQTILGRPTIESISTYASDPTLVSVEDVVEPQSSTEGQTDTAPAFAQGYSHLGIESILLQARPCSPNNLSIRQDDVRPGSKDVVKHLSRPHSELSCVSSLSSPASRSIADFDHGRLAKAQILPLRRVHVPSSWTAPLNGTPSSKSSDSQTATAKRMRASKPKVRTGCFTCKIRRVSLMFPIEDGRLHGYFYRR